VASNGASGARRRLPLLADGEMWRVVRIFSLGDSLSDHRIGFGVQSPTGADSLWPSADRISPHGGFRTCATGPDSLQRASSSDGTPRRAEVSSARA